MNATAPLSPRARYEHELLRPGHVHDLAQAHAVDALQRVYEELLATPPRRLGFGRKRWLPVPGLYLWGGVGRGKTWLMDGFYEALPFSRKLRTHFHRFMLDVHEQRRRFPDEQDPLKLVAEQYAQQVRVLCFDEFYVSDIADAMILGRLFENLFAQGVTLIATSNIPPDRLYENGLQRANFLPFIATLQRNVAVLNVDGGTDYRLRALTRAEIYHHPSDDDAEANLARWFAEIAPDAGVSPRVSSGSTSTRCAKGRAAQPTTSSWRAPTIPCCCHASLSSTPTVKTPHAASSIWSMSSTTAA